MMAIQLHLTDENLEGQVHVLKECSCPGTSQDDEGDLLRSLWETCWRQKYWRTPIFCDCNEVSNKTLTCWFAEKWFCCVSDKLGTFRSMRMDMDGLMMLPGLVGITIAIVFSSISLSDSSAA